METSVGKLTVITAPTMFAGKSDKGDYICRRASFQGTKVVKLTHASDVRQGGTTTALRHSGLVTESLIRVPDLGPDTDEVVRGAGLVWLDEAQLFKDLCSAVSRWLSMGIDVVVSGLYLDYKGDPWGDVMKCASQHPLKEFHLLHADCTRCRSEATAMHCPRIVSGEGTVLIGGKNEYAALCETCYIKFQTAS